LAFKRMLEDLVNRVPGAEAAVFADQDGEAIAAYTAAEDTEYGIKFVGAHHGILLRRAGEMLAGMDMGQTKEIIFQHERFHVLTSPLDSQYYLVLTFQGLENLGRARFELRRTVKDIAKEIG
jgi:predicted regulator of Ras-like GTPase activity (Roadblock/LC7/MglB family)